jgi:hypothetical protein
MISTRSTSHVGKVGLHPLFCLNELLRVWISIRKFRSDPHFLF